MDGLTHAITRHWEVLDALVRVADESPATRVAITTWIRRSTRELEFGCERIRISHEDDHCPRPLPAQATVPTKATPPTQATPP